MLQCGEDHVPGRPQQVPVAVGYGEDGSHALQILGGQHHGALLGAGGQRGGGQGCAHCYHLVGHRKIINHTRNVVSDLYNNKNKYEF